MKTMFFSGPPLLFVLQVPATFYQSDFLGFQQNIILIVAGFVRSLLFCMALVIVIFHIGCDSVSIAPIGIDGILLYLSFLNPSWFWMMG